ncbi:serine hydrolase domain-containing protein [Alloalcanivorax gelatiniphagus]
MLREALTPARVVVAALGVVAATVSSVLVPAAAVGRDVDDYVVRTVPAGASGTWVAVRGSRVTCTGVGLADRERGVPATCDTVYDIGSVTKQFTAAAIVKLQTMGRLDVHDRLGSWFTRPMPRATAAITLQQLLTHTSGLPDSLGDDYDPLSRRQLLRRAVRAPLHHAPGRRYAYSNLGYSLLAVVVERASGTTYERFLRRSLFRPAGMRSTGYVRPDWTRSSVAVEYDARGRSHGTPLEHPWAADGPWWNLRGNGGMLSTARDMARWHRALSSHRVLDRRALRELFRPRVREEPGSPGHYGYGWVVLDTSFGRVVWHNGGNGWSYAELLRVPSRRAAVFWVTNQVRSRDGGWDLSRLGLTEGVLGRLL